MGDCCSKSAPKQLQWIPSPKKLAYPSSVKVKIAMKDTPHYQAESVEYAVKLSPPEIAQVRQVFTRTGSYYVSSCVVPRTPLLDHASTLCQDCCLVSSNDDSLLVGVYDGHGKHGRDVSRRVKALMEHKFSQNFEPSSAFFEEAMTDCHTQLIEDPDCDVTLSGTTALHACINGNKLLVSNVGDTFGILATVSRRESPYDLPECPTPPSLKFLEMTRKLPLCNLRTLPAAIRHTPGLEQEQVRIEMSGGRVKRLAKDGKPVGVYRVWGADSKQPGLSMSRSLGDAIGTELGVIPNPTICEFDIDSRQDMFLVIATNGLWQVMQPEKVTKFVEYYRYHCTVRQVSPPNVVKPSNASIAHLLCEEARLRWLSLATKDPCYMSDIACVVIEFNKQAVKRPPRDLHQSVQVRRSPVNLRRVYTAFMPVSEGLTHYAGPILDESEVEAIED